MYASSYNLCGNQNFTRSSSSTTQRLPDGVTMPVPQRRPSQDGRAIAEKGLIEELSGAPTTLVDSTQPITESRQSRPGRGPGLCVGRPFQVEALVFEHGFDAFGYRYVRGGVVVARCALMLSGVRCSPNLAIARHALPRSVAA